MAKQKIKKKFKILPFFPYGICSKYAMVIQGKQNPYATTPLLGTDAAETIRKTENYRKSASNRARDLCSKGMIKEKLRPCGDPPQDYIFCTISKAGIADFLSIQPIALQAPSIADADNTEHTWYDTDCDGNIKENNLPRTTPIEEALQDMPYEYANAPHNADAEEIRDLFLQSVIEGRNNPLAYGLPHVQGLRISTSSLSQNQLYSIWRYSHIQAMFLANGHLTYLDRRPYDTKFRIGKICDTESYTAHVAENGNTLQAYTYRTLTEWYNTHPGYYKITQRIPDLSETAKLEWLTTPAFYKFTELPETDEPENNDKPDKTQGNPQKLYHTIVGLATGKKVNYACYHTKPGTFKWLAKLEVETKRELINIVRRMKTQCPQLQCKDATDFALMFCPTIHQFYNLFSATIEKHKRGERIHYSTDHPYTSMHVIPTHDTGTFLLWCLLEYTPLETQAIFAKSLVSNMDGFDHTTNPTYPLTYNGRRVFLGYTMDISKINRALEDHLDGYDFLICCFPEQVSWYKKLFPGKTFL